MGLGLQELQKGDSKAKELKQQKTNGYNKIDEIFYHQGLPFVLQAIKMELISCQHNNLLAGHFSIKKTLKLLT